MNNINTKKKLTLFHAVREAVFLKRPNRFVVECLMDGKKVRAYLPNPGRLLELLLPQSRLYLTPNRPDPEKSTDYTCVAVEKAGVPVMLHTHHTNTVVRHLLEKGHISGLREYSIVRQEVTLGNSRFDFLLEKGKKKFILEVKSCTLFGKRIAMFPDAVTARGRRHVLELDELRSHGYEGGVLFVIHSPSPRYFMPEHHTDLAFAQTLYSLKNRIMVKAISVGWGKDLTLSHTIQELKIPWDLGRKEAHDCGDYILILKVKKAGKIDVGSFGKYNFTQGYYCYAGSARRHLTKRIERHQRTRKNLHWHIDYLRNSAEFIAALPVRSSDRLECEIADALSRIASLPVPGFGSSDCSCGTHLFRMEENPLRSPTFIELLQYFRIDRLEKKL
jgi:sugar fermentation stimulation protein A